jgi:hypothetical protein
MAILGSTTLTNCFYIPNFLGGLDGDSRNFHSVFHNQAAPTSWTKDTSFSTNGIALRVTTGSVTTRTSLSFSQTLTDRSLDLLIEQNSVSPITTSPSPANVTITQVVANGNIQVQGALADLPGHPHSYAVNLNRPASTPGARPAFGPTFPIEVSGSAGASGQHVHSMTFGQHAHGAPSVHSHTVTAGQHSHTVPGPNSIEDFSVSYKDVIIASKDN